jgi:hypothetical protein
MPPTAPGARGTSRPRRWATNSHEAQLITSLLSGPTHVPSSSRAGMQHLLDLNLIDLDTTPHSHAPTGTTAGRTGCLGLASCPDPSAAARALRRLVRFYRLRHLNKALMHKRMTAEHPPPPTHAEAAIGLASHYEHHPVRTVYIEGRPGEVIITARTINEDLPPLTLPAHQQGTTMLPVAFPEDEGPMPSEWRALWAQTLLSPNSHFNLRCNQGPGTGTGPVVLNLDTLLVTTHDTTPAGGPWNHQRLPATTSDALHVLRAPELHTTDEFIAWASANLTVSVPCGQQHHRVRLDPHTFTLSPHPNTPAVAARHLEEHVVHALSDDGTEQGCRALATTLRTVVDVDEAPTQGDKSPLGTFCAAARVIARTVQYVEAGLRLEAIAPYVRYGFSVEQMQWIESELTVGRGQPGRLGAHSRRWALAPWSGKPVECPTLQAVAP